MKQPAHEKLGPRGRALIPLWLVAAMSFMPLTSPQAAPNILMIYMDDQRIGTNFAMPNVQKLAQTGINFTRAYITTPLCGPSRTSFLSGGFYPQANGILENNKHNGWGNLFGANLGTAKLPIALQRAGYRTAMIGKGIENSFPGAIAPGWDVLRELKTSEPYYTNSTIVAGSSGPDAPGTGISITNVPYSTDYFRDEALAFLDTVAADPQKPFFLFWAPASMHAPADPQPSGADDAHFVSYLFRGRGYGEDVSDKPDWVSNPASKTSIKVPEGDAFHQDQLRTLRDADRGIGAILAKLKAIRKYNDTIIIFASDNGYMWGEHGIYQKANAFEESARVPLVVHMPGGTKRMERRLVAVNLDVPAWILDLAGATLDPIAPGVPRVSQGLSLTPLIARAPTTWRSRLYLEGHGSSGDGSYGAWEAVVNNLGWKYVVHRSTAEELYNLKTDPFELTNLAQDSAYAKRKRNLARLANAAKGVTVRAPQWSQPVGTVGVPYSFNPTVWGGTPPYLFRVLELTPNSGPLPPGLTLDTSTGHITGVPTTPGSYIVDLAVYDSSKSPFNGLAQRWVETYTFKVK